IVVSEVNGDPTAVGQPVTLASGATITLYADGSFSYLSLPHSAYSDSFSYTAFDGTESKSTDVTIAVTNQAPTATPATATINENDKLTIPLASMFTDADGDTLTPAIVYPPTSGSAWINPSGGISYRPAPGFVGTDFFFVGVSDGVGSGFDATASVSVTVQ